MNFIIKIWCAIWMAQIKEKLKWMAQMQGKENKNKKKKMKEGFMCVCVCVCAWLVEKRRKRIGQNCPTRRKKKTAPGEFRKRSWANGEKKEKFQANQRRGKEERRDGEKRRKKNRNGFSTCDLRDPVGFPTVSVKISSFFRWVTSNHHLENPLWSSLFLLHPKNQRIWPWNWMKPYGVCSGLVYKFFKSWNVFFQLLTPLAFP